MRGPFGRSWVLGLALWALALPVARLASADWTPVVDVPETQLFSGWANGDTIAAAADTAVYVSVDAGASCHRSARLVAGVAPIEAVRMRHGRLYAGTFGQGVFTSDDLGATWHDFNQGLVGGFQNSQLDVVDFQVRGDTMVAATAGAGVYARGLDAAGTWHPFGDVFEPNQAPNVNSLALGASRLLAMAGANGMVFRRDSGDAEWTISNLDNVGLHPGLTGQSAAWTGAGWVVGTNIGVFRSVSGQEPWTLSGPVLGSLDWTTFATRGRELFAAFDTPLAAFVEESADDGATWQNAEGFSGVFVRALMVSGNTLYAARGDGLWRRPLDPAAVTSGDAGQGLRFALAGPQPFREQARLRFELPRPGRATIQVFDVLGRRVGDHIDRWWPSGPNEVALDTRRLNPGVYAARLETDSGRETVRLVRVR